MRWLRAIDEVSVRQVSARDECGQRTVKAREARRRTIAIQASMDSFDRRLQDANWAGFGHDPHVVSSRSRDRRPGG
jgi:hypothetical protein